MSWQTASTWGLTGTGPREWVTRASCRTADPRIFDVIGRHLSVENRAAMALCRNCPVRTDCRDDFLNSGRTPLGLIAGGWWWDHSGGVHPDPRDNPERRRSQQMEGAAL